MYVSVFHFELTHVSQAGRWMDEALMIISDTELENRSKTQEFI